jgi:hypothetical protein
MLCTNVQHLHRFKTAHILLSSGQGVELNNAEPSSRLDELWTRAFNPSAVTASSRGYSGLVRQPNAVNATCTRASASSLAPPSTPP